MLDINYIENRCDGVEKIFKKHGYEILHQFFVYAGKGVKFAR